MSIMISVYFFYTKIKKNQKNNIKLQNNVIDIKNTDIKNINIITSNDDKSNLDINQLLFYSAEWCGICQKIKPLWENSKKIIKDAFPNLEIKDIDCNDPNKCFIIKNNNKKTIDGVPTILLRSSGKDDIEYEKDTINNILGNKKGDDINRFLNFHLNK